MSAILLILLSSWAVVQAEPPATRPTTVPAGAKLVGRWEDPITKVCQAIYSTRDGGYVHAFESKDKSEPVVTYKLTRRRVERGWQYTPTPATRSGDYYLVLKSGELEIYDSEGLIRTLRSRPRD